MITGVIAKEIVVGTMGEIYTPKAKDEKKETALAWVVALAIYQGGNLLGLGG